MTLQGIPRGHEMNQTRNDQRFFDINDLASPIGNHAHYELILEAATKRTDWNQNKKLKTKKQSRQKKKQDGEKLDTLDAQKEKLNRTI